MVQVVFTSPFQDEADVADVGLKFRRNEPVTVTEDQAKILLTHPFFEVKPAPAPAPQPAPPARVPEKPAE